MARHRPFTIGHFVVWARQFEDEEGEPLVIRPFQRAFIEDVFAGFAECWFVVPEGNGKTSLTALIALYHARFKREASVPVAASSRDQAHLLYRQADGFVQRAQLGGVFTCLDGYRRIRVDAMRSLLQVYAQDPGTGDGVIPTLGILEELHRHPDLDLYRTWSGKLWKRGGQLIAISTAGEPGGEFEEVREKIRHAASEVVRSGSHTRFVAGRIVMHEWCVPEGADVEDMRVVKAANPMPSITLETLREKRNSPTMTATHWARFTANQPRRSEGSAILEREWDDAFSPVEIPGDVVVSLGVDCAWKWDTFAIVPLWWKDEEFRLFGRPVILVPPRDGSSLDPDAVERAFEELDERYLVEQVVMDTSRAEQLASWLSDDMGFTVVDRPQSNAYKVQEYERWMEALRSGWLHHPRDPEMTRHVLNAVTKTLPGGDARFVRPKRQRQGGRPDTRVIDALDAGAMVHAHLASADGNESSWRPM